MTDEQTFRIGVVGIGNMGAPMASNLIKAGHRVTVYDLEPDRRAAFVACSGGDQVASLADLARASEVVITMLPDGKAVRRVALGATSGDDCLVAGFSPGSTLIDMSSSDPVGTRTLESELAANGIRLIDAPVSGGVSRAVTGKLAIMAGGDGMLIDRYASVFAAMGTALHVGAVGAGHAAKVLNNLVSAAGMAAAAEAVVVGTRFGIEPEMLVRVFNSSTGKNNATENKFNQFILNEAFNSGFAMSLMVKDLGLALSVADACGVPAELGAATLKLWREASEALGPSADHTEIARHVVSVAPGERVG